MKSSEKRGRGKGDRTEVIVVRVSPDEKAKINKMAGRSRVPASELIRALALGDAAPEGATPIEEADSAERIRQGKVAALKRLHLRRQLAALSRRESAVKKFYTDHELTVIATFIMNYENEVLGLAVAP